MERFENVYAHSEDPHEHGAHEQVGDDHEQHWDFKEEADEEVFREYMDNLRLQPEDLRKNVLDVGAGSGQFAKWAREQGISPSITSVEVRPGALQEKTKGVVASAEQLPFPDGSFEMVVSNYSMPQGIRHEGEEGPAIREKVAAVFSEMFRVAKEGGEIRLVGVPMEGAPDFRPDMKQAIADQLENLKTRPGVEVELIHLPGEDGYRYEEDGVTKTDELLSKSYLVIIRKAPAEKAVEPERETAIQLREVFEGDPEYENALAIRVPPEDTKEQVEAKVRERLAEDHWYLQDYWTKKQPKEKIRITIGALNVEVYNFHNRLEEWQLDQLQRSIADYARLRNNKVFERVGHILIDDAQPANPHDGQEMNGYAGKDGAIKLYPRALKPIPHRVPGVSNLEGTVIHEPSHSLGADFETKWSEAFGWSMLDEPQPLPGGTEMRYYVNAEPERCVTTYAAINAAEDICESMVAAMRNPEALDSERYEHLRQELLPAEDERELAATVTVEHENVVLPEIDQPVTYKRLARKRMTMSPGN